MYNRYVIYPALYNRAESNFIKRQGVSYLTGSKTDSSESLSLCRGAVSFSYPLDTEIDRTADVNRSSTSYSGAILSNTDRSGSFCRAASVFASPIYTESARTAQCLRYATSYSDPIISVSSKEVNHVRGSVSYSAPIVTEALEGILLRWIMPLIVRETIGTGKYRVVKRLVLTQGVSSPYIRVSFVDEEETPLDLTGKTVTFKMADINLESTLVSAPATIMDAEAGDVLYILDTDDFDTIGDFNACFEVADNTGRFATVPSDGFLKVTINKRL